MNSVSWWIILGICVVVTFLYQKKLKNDLLRKLYALKQQKDENNFFAALDDTYTKFVLSKFSIGYMKYNYYLEEGKYEDAKIMFNELKDVKTNNPNRLSLYLSMFNKAIENKDNEFASSIKDDLVECVNKYADNKAKLIKGEIEQLDKIYLKKDVSILPELILSFEQADNDEIKSLLAFRIAKLYHYENNEQEVKKYLLLAKEYTQSLNNKKEIENIMSDLNRLDQ